jgi:hypothetical protein
VTFAAEFLRVQSLKLSMGIGPSQMNFFEACHQAVMPV